MLNRRTFVGTAVYGASVGASLSGVGLLSSAHAQTKSNSMTNANASEGLQSSSTGAYDLLIKGGRVIDPASGINDYFDVAVSGSSIVAIKKNITGTALDTIDAKGKLVIPGIVDIHTHGARNPGDAQLMLKDGVTSFIDAGSAGAQIIDAAVANIKAAPNNGRLLINIARSGVTAEGELMDIKNADVQAAQEAIAKNPDIIVGVKARLSYNVAGANDLEALKRAQEVAGKLPVMIHMGQTVSPMSKVLALLKPGDVVTHMYAPEPNSLFGANGRIHPAVLEAKKRGVLFDVGNGRAGHLWWDIAERGIKQKFLPNTISTDWTLPGRTNQVVDIENCMSRFLLLGLPLEQVVADVTSRAAPVFAAFKDRGTLKVGAAADVAIIDLREGDFNFADNFGSTRNYKYRLFPFASVMGGKKTI